MKKKILCFLFLMFCSLTSCSDENLSESKKMLRTIESFITPETYKINDTNVAHCFQVYNLYDLMLYKDNTIETVNINEEDITYDVDWYNILSPILSKKRYKSNTKYTLSDYEYIFEMNNKTGIISINTNSTNYILHYSYSNYNNRISIYELENDEVIGLYRLEFNEYNIEESLLYKQNNIFYCVEKSEIYNLIIINQENKLYDYAQLYFDKLYNIIDSYE